MNLFEAFKIAYEVPTESNGTVQISLASGIPRVERIEEDTERLKGV